MIRIPIYAVGPDGVCSCSAGAECHSPGKHPTVRGWASEEYMPPTDIDPEHAALRTDDLVVVDCDNEEAVRWWLEHEPGARSAPMVKTGRGVHFYYRRPENAPDELHSDSHVADGLDIKTGSGSYVLAAGSLHPNGTHYEWVADSADREPPPLPELVVTLLSKVRSGTTSTLAGPDSAELEWERIPDGRRNVTLAAFAGTFRKQGMSLSVLYATLKSLNKAFCDPPLGDDELKVIARSVSRYEVDPNVESIELVGDDLNLIYASELGMPPPKTWLLEPYVPDNTMTLVSGREGIGKGLFCAYMATCVTTGDYPDGSLHDEKPVLWLTSEDHFHYDIWPRLRAAGWNPERHAEVVFVDPRQLLVLPDDMQALRDAIEEVDPGLVIMDPGRSYIGSKEKGNVFSYNNESDLRPALQQLLFLSADLQLPLLFVGHWKKGDGPTQDATSGSLAWKQVVRHALDFAQVEERRAFAVGKSNHGKTGFVRGYSVEEVEDWETARFVLGELEHFNSLDAWMKDAQGRAGTPIDLDLAGIALEWAERSLEVGDAFPNAGSMTEVVPGCNSQADAQLVIEEFLRSKFIRRGPRGSYIWLGAAPAVGA